MYRHLLCNVSMHMCSVITAVAYWRIFYIHSFNAEILHYWEQQVGDKKREYCYGWTEH